MSMLQLENIRHAAGIDIILGCLYLTGSVTGLWLLWYSRSAARAENRERRERRAFVRLVKRR